MIKYELKKYYTKRYTKLLLVLIIIMSVVSPVLSIKARKGFVVDENGQYMEYRGKEAIEAEKERYKKVKGELTTEKLQEVLYDYKNTQGSFEEKFVKSNESHPGILNLIATSYSPYGEINYSVLEQINDTENFYSNRINKLEERLKDLNEKEKTEIVNRVKKIKEPFNYAYDDGWRYVGSNTSFILYMIAIAMVLIASDIFSYEKNQNMSSIFYSLNSKSLKKIIKNKIISLNVFAIMLCITLCLISFCILISGFGLEGARSQIQISSAYWYSIYNITFLKLFSLQLFLGTLGILLITNLTLIINKITEKNFLTIIISGVCIFIPWVLSEIKLPELLSKLIAITPVNALNVSVLVINPRIFKIFGLDVLGTTAMSLFFMILIIATVLFVPRAYIIKDQGLKIINTIKGGNNDKV